jgi:hypothetical protein
VKGGGEVWGREIKIVWSPTKLKLVILSGAHVRNALQTLKRGFLGGIEQTLLSDSPVKPKHLFSCCE